MGERLGAAVRAKGIPESKASCLGPNVSSVAVQGPPDYLFWESHANVVVREFVSMHPRLEEASAPKQRIHMGIFWYLFLLVHQKVSNVVFNLGTLHC